MNKKISKDVITLGLLAFIIILFLSIYFTTYYKPEDILTKKEVEWLSSQKTLIYGSDKNSPPLRYVEQYDEQYRGVLIDYINSLSVEIGTNIEFHPMIWEDALKNLYEGKTNLCDMFISEKRKEIYLFTKPIYNLRGVLSINNGLEEVKRLEDLEGMDMAVQKGDYASEYLQLNYPNINQIFVNDLEEALLKVSNGEVAATLGDEPVILFNIDRNNLSSKIKIIEKPIYENQVAFAVPKSMPELIPILNKGINSLKKKNLLEKIQQKWFGISTPIVKAIDINIVKKYIIFVSLLVGILILLMILWNKYLQKLIKNRTKELEQSKNDLQIVFDGMSESILVLDYNKDILNINKSFLDFISKTKEEVLGINYKKALELFSKINIDDLIDEILTEQNAIYQEKQLDNYIYEVRLYTLINNENNEKNVLILLNNITNEKISNSKLLHTNKMVAIGELAAGVAHEIRNPLGIIRNHSYIIKNNHIDDELIQGSIKYIDGAVIRANNIIENLLNFSSISRNTIENINIYDFINNIIEMQKRLMKTKDINYIIDCDKRYCDYINQESLKHIFINLITNAVDSVESTGSIIIRAYNENRNIIIECIDTGKGILEEEKEKVFDPFYTTKELGKGTGLGLYITYNEIKKLNGNIYLESEIGVGTKFKLIIPCNS